MPLKIKNTSTQSRTFNLAHDGLRDAGPPYGYTVRTGGVVDEDALTGARRPRATRKALPASITFLAGETKSELPNLVKDCPEIKAALGQKGPLKLLEETPMPSNDTQPAKPTSIAPNRDALTQVPHVETGIDLQVGSVAPRQPKARAGKPGSSGS